MSPLEGEPKGALGVLSEWRGRKERRRSGSEGRKEGKGERAIRVKDGRLVAENERTFEKSRA